MYPLDPGPSPQEGQEAQGWRLPLGPVHSPRGWPTPPWALSGLVININTISQAHGQAGVLPA